MRLHHFVCNGTKTGIAKTDFQKKGLADLAVNVGHLCKLGCSYCYVDNVMNKLPAVQAYVKKGYGRDTFSLYREKANIVECLNRDLARIDPSDTRVVFFCTTCDPCPDEETTATTVDAIRMLMERSKLSVRILSKKTLVRTVAEKLQAYRHRIIFGLSTGTADPAISAAIEQNASPILERVETLHWLQDNGFRTFGMLCPVLPSEVDDVKKLIDQIRPEHCEQIWAEAMNTRGKALPNTVKMLAAAGLNKHAQALNRVIGDKRAWVEYAKRLLIGLETELKKCGLSEKLTFLQYIRGLTPEETSFFSRDSRVKCLESITEKDEISINQDLIPDNKDIARPVSGHSTGQIICPCCGLMIKLEIKPVGTDTQKQPESRMGNPIQPSLKNGKRKLTDDDRSIILRNNAAGWKNISKNQLAKELGLTIAQIAAVCAWTHPSLGGDKYKGKYRAG